MEEICDSPQESQASQDTMTDLSNERQILVKGQQFEKMPEDLFIPPDALEIFLDAFSGPMDLLLYLIRKHNFDILDIPIAEITIQYMEYVELMKNLKLELAADYLVMAAMLAEIKSRMLLPRQPVDDAGEEIDPRAELVKRLQEYERFKAAADNINALPQVGRNVLLIDKVELPKESPKTTIPDIKMDDLMAAFLEVLKRSELLATHRVEKEALSVRERMTFILDSLTKQSTVRFEQFFNKNEGRMGVVVTFLAMLELLKESLIDMVQTEPFGPIHLKALEYETDEEAYQ